MTIREQKTESQFHAGLRTPRPLKTTKTARTWASSPWVLARFNVRSIGNPRRRCRPRFPLGRLRYYRLTREGREAARQEMARMSALLSQARVTSPRLKEG